MSYGNRWFIGICLGGPRMGDCIPQTPSEPFRAAAPATALHGGHAQGAGGEVWRLCGVLR